MARVTRRRRNCYKTNLKWYVYTVPTASIAYLELKCRKTWLMTFWKFRFHINVYINTCTTCVWWRFGNLIHVIQISDQYMKYGNSTLMFQQGRNEMLKTRSLKRGFPSLGNHTETPSFQHVSRWFPWRKLGHSAKFPVWGNDYARSNFIEEWMR